jgi:hypothetical protein
VPGKRLTVCFHLSEQILQHLTIQLGYLDANGWYKGATKDLAALWEDDNVKEVFWRRHEASFVLPFSVSSSTSEYVPYYETL